MKRTLIRLCLITVCGMMLSSCATMTRWCDSSEKNEQMYTVYINSATRGLPVTYVENNIERFAGTTPCSIYSDKAKVKYVTVKNGDIYQTITLKRKDRLSTYWNFFPYFTFIWGYFVDKGTSRSRIYGQKEYFVDM